MTYTHEEYPYLYHLYKRMKNNANKMGKKVYKPWAEDRKAFYEWAVNNGCAKGLSIKLKNPYGEYYPDNVEFRKEDKKESNVKSVDRTEFEIALDLYIQGKLTQKQAAKYCGLSHESFKLRTRQYVAPETYGELPPNFFMGVNQIRTKKATSEDKKLVEDILRNDEDLKMQQMAENGYISPICLPKFEEG